MSQTISPQQFAECCRQGSVDLIDVRTPVEFREVHLEQARNVPLDSLDPQKIMQARNGTAEQPLYIVCKSGARGAKAQQKFISAGYDNVINVEGGTEACVAAGLSSVRGKKAMSLERQVRIAAGAITFAGALAALLTNNVYYAGIPAFIGAGLVFAGITDTCGMGMIIAKMPWNQVKDCGTSCSA